MNSLLSQDLSVDEAGPEGSPDTTVPPPQLLHASPAHSSVPQQLPCPSSSMMQVTQTVPEAQSTLRDPRIVQSTPKTPPLTLQVTMSAQVPAHAAQLSTCAVTQVQGRPQAAHSEENISPVSQQSSPVSMPLPPFNPVQPAAAKLAAPHQDSVRISQT